MDLLGKIFGSDHRVKIMRLFLFNETTAFDIDDVANRTRVKNVQARKEISLLLKIGFLRKKQFSKKIQKPLKKKTDKPTWKTLKKSGWTLNRSFSLLTPLRTLLLDSDLIHEKDLIKRLKKTGQIKLLILSGVFMKNTDRKLDILIVGNKLKKEALEKEITLLESEIGRELRYAFFDEEEFFYRISMYDKLVRDVIENDNHKLIHNLTY